MSSPTTIPRLTLGLPVYNGERYLAESVDALLAQTFSDFELIISDNASTDGTGRSPSATRRRILACATSATRRIAAHRSTTTS